MINTNIFERSPISKFEKTGGLKNGEIGVIGSKSGLGKTSVLVQFGINYILQGKKVLHFSFKSANSDLAWYDSIVTELTKSKPAECCQELKETIKQNRVILGMEQGIFNSGLIAGTTESLMNNGIKTDVVIIDGPKGFKLDKKSAEELKAFAKKSGTILWITVNTEGEMDCETPDAIISLEEKGDSVILKNGNTELALDPRTLLLK